MIRLKGTLSLFLSLALAPALSLRAEGPDSVSEQRAEVLRLLASEHGLGDEQVAAIEAIFNRSSVLSQGNPAITQHPMTPATCRERRRAAGLVDRDPEFERICHGPYMAPLYDPAVQHPEDATACIDQYEFPDVPCTFPVVWIKTSEAAEVCEAMGKRLCDAHEWEGGCAGALGPADYRFDLATGRSAEDAVRAMRSAHNSKYSPTKAWSYGPAFAKGICAQASTKSPSCNGGDWKACGSNTYPTGSFPACRSALDVYDTNGNAAEHMNLPLASDQMASTGSGVLGVTEMKGSWFIWDSYQAHEDWCRWRAPYWHGAPVRSDYSHHNYHLGFRCCKTLPEPG
jgi:hypothetical protein